MYIYLFDLLPHSASLRGLCVNSKEAEPSCSYKYNGRRILVNEAGAPIESISSQLTTKMKFIPGDKEKNNIYRYHCPFPQVSQ